MDVNEHSMQVIMHERHFILHLPSAHNNLECVGILRVFIVTGLIQCKVDRPQITHCVDISRYKYVPSCYFKRGRRLSNTPETATRSSGIAHQKHQNRKEKSTEAVK